jgi:hypothetical protein
VSSDDIRCHVYKYLKERITVCLNLKRSLRLSSGKLSATLVIPIEIARRYGLEKPAHVIIEERPDGILIRRITI